MGASVLPVHDLRCINTRCTLAINPSGTADVCNKLQFRSAAEPKGMRR
jgi:hypothetical protein